MLGRGITGRFTGWKPGFLGMGLLLALGACTTGVPEEEVAAKDQQIVGLQSQVSTLQAQAGNLEQANTYWTQLTALFEPVMMPSMTDHRAVMLPGGSLLALHFDNAILSQAKNLNWVALGVPGTWCKQDQERVTEEFGPGFTHFHDLMKDTHGGTTPGVEGVWFVHVAVRDFESPMSGGAVKQGVDMNFMPTEPPVCG
ncbi:MAG: hypothetical protein HY532_06095 [Chloroflexi bacterium]|nr:hypothetical protein [Chloroflexota bacterium]